jgi:hypothetical protein
MATEQTTKRQFGESAEGYKKYPPTTEAREMLAVKLSSDEQFSMLAEPALVWDDWADNDYGKGHWRARADLLVDFLREAGYTVTDTSHDAA